MNGVHKIISTEKGNIRAELRPRLDLLTIALITDPQNRTRTSKNFGN